MAIRGIDDKDKDETRPRIDADEVHARIYVGSVPPRGFALANAGFTHLVLCAAEFQLPAEDFPRIEVHRCPFDYNDTYSGRAYQRMQIAVRDMARRVANLHRKQTSSQVLITCAAGINRSALVAGLSMVYIGVPPADVIHYIRKRRFPYSLSNKLFERMVLTA